MSQSNFKLLKKSKEKKGGLAKSAPIMRDPKPVLKPEVQKPIARVTLPGKK